MGPLFVQHRHPAHSSDFAESGPLGDTPEGFFLLDYDGSRKDLDTVIEKKVSERRGRTDQEDKFPC